MDFRLPICLICALAAILTTTNCSASNAAAREPIHGWIFLAYDMPYLRNAIDTAETYGVNHIQLSHDMVMDAESVLVDEQLAADINELTNRAHSHGMEVYIWTHELMHVPDRLRENGKVRLDDPSLKVWLKAKYARLFDAVPNLDGLVLTLSETHVRVFDDNAIITSMSKPERVTMVADTLYEVCRAKGKGLIVRDWGNLGTSAWEDLRRIQQGLDASNPEIRIMTKYTAGDWYMNARNPLIGSMTRHEQIEEFDLAGEHHGQALIPWCIPELIKEEYTFAHKKGIVGACGRVSRSVNHALGTPNEINLYALRRIIADPDIDLDTIWRGWAVERFGAKAAPHVISALKRTRGIIDRIMYVKRIYFLQDHTAMPTLDYPASHVRGISAGYWDKELGRAEEKILSPTREFIAKVLAEKDEGIEMCRASLADIERAKPHLTDKDYQWLKSFLDRELVMAQTWRALAAAYFEYALPEEERDMERLDSLLTSLEKAADRLDTSYGPDYQFGIPGQGRSYARKRLHQFAEEIRKRTR